MYDVPSFLKRDGDSLLFNKEGSLVFYIPELYFERNYAVTVDEYVNIIGVLDYAIFDNKGKHDGLKRFNFPTVFLCQPSEIEKVKNVKLTKSSEAQDYRLLKFLKGDRVVVSVKVPKINENVEEFYKIFTCGKLPTTIPYSILQDYFIENMRLNGGSYGVTTQMFGFVIGELCKDPHDQNKLFRHTNYTDETAYQTVSLVEAPKLISPYSAIVSQNWDEALVAAIVNKNQVDSPMEKLLTI